MKNIIIIVVLFIIAFQNKNFAQVIPYGNSMDSVTVHYDYDNVKYAVFYYKPVNYDPNTSPILFGVHGQGGSGASSRATLIAIADRRKALIVAPTMPLNWTSGYDVIPHFDSEISCSNFYWHNIFMKKIYQNVLHKENRNNINMYLIGFSAGGQFVTRYMLIRQGHPDSIPIKMAVSSNAYYYTYCTDSLNGEYMYYPCGIGGQMINFMGNCYPQSDGIADTLSFGFSCNEHIVQYYNENYAVLIGTADIINASTGITCIMAQGANRLERARNFYSFSMNDANERGSSLKWRYAEIQGVGHDGYAMYNTPYPGDTIPIAEQLLFDVPSHTVYKLTPEADFTANTTVVNLQNATVNFTNNSINAISYLWDFGDSTTSTATNPSHTYLHADTFTVTLTSFTNSGCSNTSVKKNYIIVKNGYSIDDISNDEIYIIPNPAKETINIYNAEKGDIHIYNVLGEEVKNAKCNEGNNSINVSNLATGTYILKIVSAKNVVTKKIVINK